jgi:hypothetical protein
MATTLSSPLSDPGGCLICQRLSLAVVLVDLANTSKEIIPCFSITARFAGSHRSLQPDTARLPVQLVPLTIRQRQGWWSRWDSNPRPPRCHRGALPTAPRPHRRTIIILHEGSVSVHDMRNQMRRPMRNCKFLNLSRKDSAQHERRTSDTCHKPARRDGGSLRHLHWRSNH